MLAPYLPVAVPVPIGLGVPSEEYPWPWIVYGWLDGEVAVEDRLVDAAGAGTPRPRAAIAELHGSIETDAAATWARGRGWALSMALIQLPYYQIRMPREQCEAWIDLLVGWTEQITRTIGAGAPLTCSACALDDVPTPVGVYQRALCHLTPRIRQRWRRHAGQGPNRDTARETRGR